MIYVSQEQLDQVNYLLSQSALGNHLLFDQHTLRRVLPNLSVSTIRSPEVEKAEKLMEQMILRPTIGAKKAFLESLSPELHDDVARVYFNIVQNTARETQACH
ncbi:MAG: hypothetical protein EOP11_13510 [Proteobacteria bacterium]|nr:MAG: hypothetical protein EOP11_13510 [Pseudomonadota bacterium]